MQQRRARRASSADDGRLPWAEKMGRFETKKIDAPAFSGSSGKNHNRW
jgi:hypothetical protein